MNGKAMQIGDMILVIPVASHDGNRWSAKCPELSNALCCSLIHKGHNAIVADAPLTGWVLAVDESRGHIEVSDSNFGFLPISDRMRPRYVSSLRLLVSILAGQRSASPEDADAISEVKGMFSRCTKRDQWDWHAVWMALGMPTFAVARETAGRLRVIATDLRAGNIEAAQSGFDEMNASDIVRLLTAATNVIVSATPRFAKSAVTVGARSRKVDRAGERDQRSVLSTYAKEKLDCANAAHKEILFLLADYLGARGHRVESNQFVDAFARLKSGPAIFEAKSVTDQNELSQVRHGLSQLYEYRFRHGLTDASLWLLLSRAPKEKWLVDYLETDRRVHLLWLEDGDLAGPSADILLESGSATVRREQPDTDSMAQD